MLLDDALGDREAEVGAFSDFLGGEEGIENALFQSRRNAWTRVGEAQLYGVVQQLARDLDTPGRHGRQRVARVGQQIDKHLFELNGVADDPGPRLGLWQAQDHLDLAQTELLAHERQRAPNGLGDVYRLATDRRGTAEHAQMRDDLAGFVHLLHRRVEIAQHTRLIAFRHAQLDQIHRVAD